MKYGSLQSLSKSRHIIIVIWSSFMIIMDHQLHLPKLQWRLFSIAFTLSTTSLEIKYFQTFSFLLRLKEAIQPKEERGRKKMVRENENWITAFTCGGITIYTSMPFTQDHSCIISHHISPELDRLNLWIRWTPDLQIYNAILNISIFEDFYAIFSLSWLFGYLSLVYLGCI